MAHKWPSLVNLDGIKGNDGMDGRDSFSFFFLSAVFQKHMDK